MSGHCWWLKRNRRTSKFLRIRPDNVSLRREAVGRKTRKSKREIARRKEQERNSKAEKARKKKISMKKMYGKVRKKLYRYQFIVGLLGVLTVGMLAGCSGSESGVSSDEEVQGETEAAEVTETVETPTTGLDFESAKDGRVDFEVLQAENPEIFGWLYIPGTEIDQPLLQSATSDTYYQEHTADGKEGMRGALYIHDLVSQEFYKEKGIRLSDYKKKRIEAEHSARMKSDKEEVRQGRSDAGRDL